MGAPGPWKTTKGGGVPGKLPVAQDTSHPVPMSPFYSSRAEAETSHRLQGFRRNEGERARAAGDWCAAGLGARPSPALQPFLPPLHLVLCTPRWVSRRPPLKSSLTLFLHYLEASHGNGLSGIDEVGRRKGIPGPDTAGAKVWKLQREATEVRWAEPGSTVPQMPGQGAWVCPENLEEEVEGGWK